MKFLSAMFKSIKSQKPLAGLAIALASAFALVAPAHAEYPERQIRFVAPIAPGGLTDLFARMLGQRLSERLGQPVVIDNKPGAGGIVATDYVAKSAPDGYTIFIGTLGTVAVNPSLYKKLPYDPVLNFRPIALMASFPVVLVVNPNLPAKNINEFIALAKAKRGGFNYGSAGNASSAHLAMELFRRSTGLDMTHIPFRGEALVVTDILAGRIDASFVTYATAWPYVQAGRLRALGIANKERSTLAPELPTIAEQGVVDFDMAGWYGILAPAGTPQPIVDRLEREFLAIVNDPAMRADMALRGLEPIAWDGKRFARYIDTEIDKWRRLVEAAHLKAD